MYVFFKNIFAKIWLFLFRKNKVIVANKEAVVKMQEFHDSVVFAKIFEVEKIILELSKIVKEIHEISKVNQEFILYLCTTQEELVNILSGEESSSEPDGSSCEDHDDKEKDPLMDPAILKKNLVN